MCVSTGRRAAISVGEYLKVRMKSDSYYGWKRELT